MHLLVIASTMQRCSPEKVAHEIPMPMHAKILFEDTPTEFGELCSGPKSNIRTYLDHRQVCA